MSVVRNGEGSDPLPPPDPPRCYVPEIQVAYMYIQTFAIFKM